MDTDEFVYIMLDTRAYAFGQRANPKTKDLLLAYQQSSGKRSLNGRKPIRVSVSLLSTGKRSPVKYISHYSLNSSAGDADGMTQHERRLL
uniref:Uncharacterized protein n=1 Tax=Steinernema glaseri TaxID=37863 RepID=A0A1I7YUQ3_9BILA